MSVCSVAYVKSFIHSEKMSDAEIQSIIDNTTDDILKICGVSDSSIPDITMAIRYMALANTLRYLKTTGELAPSAETPEYKQQNSTDKDIERYQQLADELTQPYIILKNSNFNSTFSSPSFIRSITSTDGGARCTHRR